MRALTVAGLLVLALALQAGTRPVAAAVSAQAAPPDATPASMDTTTQPVAVPEPGEKALRYHRSGNVLWIVGTLWGFAVPAVLLFTGFSARLRTVAQRVGRRWFPTVAIYAILFTIVTFLIDLPLAFYQDFVRQHAYDLSNQTFARWATDAVKALAVGCVAAALLLWIPYLLLRRSPTRWWLYTALAAIPVMFLVMLVVPVWVDPLFNEFGPMKDRNLEARILDLASRAGIEGSRVYEVDKSADTEMVNAYVTGFLNTKRIVLWDTLVAKLDADEVLFVMGHEMGHYVLGHVITTVPFLSFVTLVTLYVAHRLSRGVIARCATRFGFDRLSDVASLPLLILLTNVLGFVITPGVLTFTRHQEREADRFGLEITRNNRAAATSFVKLQQENLAVPRPGPIVTLWRASHPVLGDRIDFANTYHPWREGRSGKYEHLFR
jgi:Zn-dependent protease with chaperone function